MARNFPSTFQPFSGRLESFKPAEILGFGEVLSYLPTKSVFLEKKFTGAAVSLYIYLGWKGKKGKKGRRFPPFFGFRPFRPFQAEPNTGAQS